MQQKKLNNYNTMRLPLERRYNQIAPGYILSHFIAVQTTEVGRHFIFHCQTVYGINK